MGLSPGSASYNPPAVAWKKGGGSEKCLGTVGACSAGWGALLSGLDSLKLIAAGNAQPSSVILEQVLQRENCTHLYLHILFIFSFKYFIVYAITAVPLFPPSPPSTQPIPTSIISPLTVVHVHGSFIRVL